MATAAFYPAPNTAELAAVSFIDLRHRAAIEIITGGPVSGSVPGGARLRAAAGHRAGTDQPACR